MLHPGAVIRGSLLGQSATVAGIITAGLDPPCKMQRRQESVAALGWRSQPESESLGAVMSGRLSSLPPEFALPASEAGLHDLHRGGILIPRSPTHPRTWPGRSSATPTPIFTLAAVGNWNRQTVPSCLPTTILRRALNLYRAVQSSTTNCSERAATRSSEPLLRDIPGIVKGFAGCYHPHRQCRRQEPQARSLTS